MNRPERRRGRLAYALIGWWVAGGGSLGCGESGSSGSSAAPLLVFGRTGFGPGELSYPRAIAMAADGGAFVVDKAGRIQKFDQDGRFVLEWRTPAIEAGKPTGLTVAADGRVWVADTHYARVLVFSASGALEAQHGTFGETCGQFHLPTDVAVAPDGTWYVGEYGGNDRISRFGPDDACVAVFGDAQDSKIQFSRPQSLHFDRDDGTLWVADARNHRIVRVDRAGELLGEFGRGGTAVGEIRFPYGIDQLSDGSLVIAEYGNNRVQRFTRDGQTLGVWGKAGRKPGELAYPWAIGVDARDRVWVVDSGNNRVQIIDGQNPRNWRR